MYVNRERTIIYGCGTIGQSLLPWIAASHDVLFFVTTSCKGEYAGLQIKTVEVFNDKNLEFDKVIIAVQDSKTIEEIKKMLITVYKIPKTKIETYKLPMLGEARREFIIQFAKYAPKGNVAELGVFQGTTSAVLNEFYPGRTLYMFDTFSSFDKEQLADDIEKFSNGDSLIPMGKILYDNTPTIDAIMSKMIHPEKCVIKKGVFPDTFDIPNETFCFVNIDPDLYEPTKAGLELFYPRLSKGGVILVHDYSWIQGVSEAVDEFLAKTPDAFPLPIGDHVSIAIIKPY
jgi:predicted O-methyltransferase YrrM